MWDILKGSIIYASSGIQLPASGITRWENNFPKPQFFSSGNNHGPTFTGPSCEVNSKWGGHVMYLVWDLAHNKCLVEVSGYHWNQSLEFDFLGTSMFTFKFW